VRRHYGELGNRASMPGGSAAHQEHDALDGVACGGLVRRIRLLPPSEKMRSVTALWEATARFFLPGGRVKHGDDDGGYSDARGGPHRWRWSGSGHARVLIWTEIEQRRKKVS
jgi:hypothetical protein